MTSAPYWLKKTFVCGGSFDRRPTTIADAFSPVFSFSTVRTRIHWWIWPYSSAVYVSKCSDREKRGRKLTIPLVQTLTIKPFFIPLSQYPVERPISLNIAQTHKYTKSAQKIAVLRRREFKQETSAISTLTIYITRVPLQYCVVALLSLARSEFARSDLLNSQENFVLRYKPDCFLIAMFTYSHTHT